MKITLSENTLWKYLFFVLICGYGLFYAPYGVNETDGGFLTGLAWQILNNKILYKDVIYVRPPLSVWLRALEIRFLPEHLEILGERWLFYAKVGLYSWLAAALLYRGKQRWILATFGFVVSAHCYPAMAWHTVDGIMFAVIAAYLFFRFDRKISLILAGVSLFAALLCKQSFYPLLPIFLLTGLCCKGRKVLPMLSGFAIAGILFINHLWQNELLADYLAMTGGSTDGGQAITHGIVDYFMITPELALPGIAMLGVGWYLRKSPRFSRAPMMLWRFWLFALTASFMAVTWLRQEHTAPFAQSRAMFWIAAAWILIRFYEHRNQGFLPRKELVAMLLLGITWSAAISWGYSLPLLFSTPWMWAGMEISARLQKDGKMPVRWLDLLLLLALVLAFRVGYEFIYRNGKRQQMTEHMGDIFPQLSGIYSTPRAAAQYRELKMLAQKYGPVFKVLPAFPQSNYLTNTTPPLPLDWVVNRETNSDNGLIFTKMSENKPVLFFEKNYLEKLKTDPQLEVSRVLFEQSTLLEEAEFFVVKR